jgi:hypothetical protein
MSSAPVDQRIENFEEVELGYREAEAITEAKRCLRCDLEKAEDEEEVAEKVEVEEKVEEKPEEKDRSSTRGKRGSRRKTRGKSGGTSSTR